MKLNPLADWTRERVDLFVRENFVPYNPLHDRGFPSIGCAPCTRAVKVGEPERAGRWWREQEDKKECGLHVGRPGAAVQPGQEAAVFEPTSETRQPSSPDERRNGRPAPETHAPSPARLSHLKRLEAEAIHIFRETVAETENPVMLYSIGKDSSVLLHLALKAFAPGKLPFPLLHVDTTWKFKEMIAFRDARAKELGLDLLVHTNQDGLARGIGPVSHGSEVHTDVMKTQALRQALDQHKFDAAFGGARRDEEASRAKERIVSLRTAQHRWDPKRQRAEPWHLYNLKKKRGESLRVFPLSNWTELDIWLYIEQENIPIVPLYFAAPRPVVERDGQLLMVDDDRLPLNPGETPQQRVVRFRTLGCYPLTGAVESEAASLPEIIAETLAARTSERQGRVIDKDGAGAMERKKQEGYF